MSLPCTAYRFSTFIRKKAFTALTLLFGTFIAAGTTAQNLFANSGFEDINICTEYNATCAPEAWYYIKPTTNPVVNRFMPKALLGKSLLMVPVHNVFDSIGARPYVYTMLGCPLVTGEQYRLRFYLNTSGKDFYNLDFYFSEKEPAARYFRATGIAPSFSITQDNVVAELKMGWKAVEYLYTATGNDRFCMLGNMSQRMNYKIKDKMNVSGEVFYFLDEIRLVPFNDKPVCGEYHDNISRMYAQNYRHTEYTLVVPEESKPALSLFTRDTISVPSVFFETNSATLKPGFKKIMDSVANVLQKNKVARIDIIGHTDNKGTAADNMLLSLTRARAVKNYLINKLPQYAENTFIEGKGQDHPVAENTTEQGRTKNRRVEIILTIVDEKK